MKNILKIIVLWLISISGVYAAEANCRKPASEIDIAICQDWELGNLDKTLSKRFDAVYSYYSSRLRASLVNGQRKWIDLRSKACLPEDSKNRLRMRDCLVSVYAQRIQELQDLSDIQKLYKYRPDLTPPDVEKILDDTSVDISTASNNRPIYLIDSDYKITINPRTCREVFTLTKGLWAYGQDAQGLFSSESALSACALKILSVQNFKIKKNRYTNVNFHDIKQYWMELPYIGASDNPNVSDYIDGKTKTFQQAADAGKIRILNGSLVSGNDADNMLIIDNDFFYVMGFNYRYLEVSRPGDYANKERLEALLSLVLFDTGGSARHTLTMLATYDPSTSSIRMSQLNSDYRLKLVN